MVERRIRKEFKEPLSPSDGYRIAGALEIAGSAGFHLDFREGISSPFCQMTEKRQDIPFAFQEGYGGRAKRRGGSWQWIVAGSDAARIGEACIDVAPSRIEMFELFLEWKNAEGHAERFEISRRLPTSHRSPVREEEYINLLDNPYFFAGIFDARGTDIASYKERKNGSVAKELAINIASTNIQLLSAIKKRLGGTFQVRGGEKSFGKSINLVVASGAALETIESHRRDYGILSGVTPKNIDSLDILSDGTLDV